MIVILLPDEARTGAVALAQGSQHFRAADIQARIVIFGDCQEHRKLDAVIDVIDRGTVGIKLGVGAEIGLHILAIGILGIIVQPIAPADQDRTQNARPVPWLQRLVENIRRHMGRARRMAHQPDATRIAAILRGMGLHPLDHAAEILNRTRPVRGGSQAVFDVESQHALAREPVTDIARDLAAILGPRHIGAAMHEDEDGRVLQFDRLINVDHLLGVAAVRDIFGDYHAILGRGFQQRFEQPAGGGNGGADVFLKARPDRFQFLLHIAGQFAELGCCRRGE